MVTKMTASALAQWGHNQTGNPPSKNENFGSAARDVIHDNSVSVCFGLLRSSEYFECTHLAKKLGYNTFCVLKSWLLASTANLPHKTITEQKIRGKEQNKKTWYSSEGMVWVVIHQRRYTSDSSHTDSHAASNVHGVQVPGLLNTFLFPFKNSGHVAGALEAFTLLFNS